MALVARWPCARHARRNAPTSASLPPARAGGAGPSGSRVVATARRYVASHMSTIARTVAASATRPRACASLVSSDSVNARAPCEVRQRDGGVVRDRAGRALRRGGTDARARTLWGRRSMTRSRIISNLSGSAATASLAVAAPRRDAGRG